MMIKKKLIKKIDSSMIRLFTVLTVVWLITTSAYSLQIINLGDLVPTVVKWGAGIIQALLITGVLFMYKRNKAVDDFIISQTEKNKTYERASHDIQDLHNLVSELKGVISQIKK